LVRANENEAVTIGKSMMEHTVDEILRHIKFAYGEFFKENRKEALDPLKVPVALRPFIPYAELWGVTDDLEREQLVMGSPQAAKDDLVALVRDVDDDLDRWLAGEEADSLTPSKEYIAFTAMRMAADFM
jgi:hypothetical protein